MKLRHIFIAIFLLAVPLACCGQKITIRPDYIVAKTDFTINSKSGGYDWPAIKANLIADEVRKDSLAVFVVNRGFCLKGLRITFKNDSIIPAYYFWDDGGGHVTELKFDSYELTLNATNYKIGDLMTGKFSGVATETTHDGKVVKHKLSGKFKHMIENSPEKSKANAAKEAADHNKWLAEKRFLQTGFYNVMSARAGVELNAPTYMLKGTDEEFYLYSHARKDFSKFEKAVAEPDSLNPALTNIRLVYSQKLQSHEAKFEHSMQLEDALVFDDVLWYVGKIGSFKNRGYTIPVRLKSKTDAATLIKKINGTIIKDKKEAAKKPKPLPVEGG